MDEPLHAPVRPRAIDPNELDPAVNPATDFFAFVNKKWIEKNPIPAEESRWGSFSVLRVQVEHQLRAILEELEARPDVALDPNAKKVRDFYRTGMDVEALNRLGTAPLAELLAKIDAVASLDDLSAAIGYLHRRGIGAWWAPSVEQDEKNSEVMVLHLFQGGLSLPDRDYYLKDDGKSLEIRAKYLSYAKEQWEKGTSEAGEAVSPISNTMAIEQQLAAASMTRVELRDVEKLYHKMTLAELAVLAPRVNWQKYFSATGIGAAAAEDGAPAAAMPEYVIVGQPKFFAEVDRMFETLPLEEIKKYLSWHVLNELANFLSEEFEKRRFDFYGRTFGGATEMRPRWRRVLGVVNALLDEAVAHLYVARHFSEDAKHKINALVDHLTAAYRARIGQLEWMGDDTKKKALAKLSAVSRKLGYPDKWKDIGALSIGTDSYVLNYMAAYMFEFDRQMRKIGQPVDRTEWYMSPQTVNACYAPTLNEILFPAAILQPPFFDPSADDAVNFGGIGTVIGHELTHGFDDQGALFDPAGNLNNWWTAQDKERFDKQTAHLAEQFDKYEPLPGVHVNGKLTLGENIADLGAMFIAYDAFLLAREAKAKSGSGEDATRENIIDGFTPIQRFFINYAITERGAMREEALRLQVQTDPHSPSPYRVNGPLSNIPEFYAVFECTKGDALWREPDDRVNIW